MSALGITAFFNVFTTYDSVKKNIDEFQKQVAALPSPIATAQKGIDDVQVQLSAAKSSLDAQTAELNALNSAAKNNLATQTAESEALNASRRQVATQTAKQLAELDAAQSTLTAKATEVTAAVSQQQQSLETARTCPSQPIPDPAIFQIEAVPVSACLGGRPYGPPIALSLHTFGGPLNPAKAYFRSGARPDFSLHFVIGLNGDVVQFVSLSDRAFSDGVVDPGSSWSRVCSAPCTSENGRPNNWIVSISTEDMSSADTPVTDQQYAAVVEVSRLAMSKFPSIRWLVTPSDLSAGRANNPGPRWIASGRFRNLANALNLQTLR
jgi:N-acetyl-anhydromuramyl-L-alanine amidase AmpD